MNSFGKQIWLISDTHFYHANIIKYCHRPYKTVEEMNDDIIKKWNSIVSKNDIVFHLGDFAFFKKVKQDHISDIVHALNGSINLILGNHDRHVSNDLKFWYKLGFAKVYDKPILFMDNYILSHEPLKTKNKVDLQYYPTLKNIFGHVHNSNADFYALPIEDRKHWNENDPKYRPIPDITKYSFNVSIEVIDYKPIQFETVAEKMNNA